MWAGNYCKQFKMLKLLQQQTKNDKTGQEQQQVA